jgi:hypothetical protein
MKKKIVLRGLLGAPLGIAISYVITVFLSLIIGDGAFHSVTPYLIEMTGSEMNAVLLQTVLSCLMGAGFGMASVIWEIDSWSLAKQSGIYFAIICAVMFPIAYSAGWMPHTAAGAGLYVTIFVVIFVAVWLIQYFTWKGRVRRLNEKILKQ